MRARQFWYKYLGKPLKPVFEAGRKIYTPSDRMVRKLRFIGEFEVKTEDGRRFFLYSNGFYLEAGFFWLGPERFRWEYMSRKVWTDLSSSADTIVDIGANTGIFSVLAKTYNKTARVYAFEPQPNIFEILERNNRINNFDIRAERLALCDRRGELPFYNYGQDSFKTGNTTAGSLNQRWRPDGQASIMVSADTLSAYLEENDVPKIDLMKIDVETLEFEVLAGYGPYLNAHRPAVLLEIQHTSIGDKLRTLFDPLDYAYYEVDEEEGLRLVDTLGSGERGSNYLLIPSDKAGSVRRFELGAD